jgi:hypothetical protein
MSGAQPKRLLEPGKNPEDAQAWIDALEGPYADRKGKNYLRWDDGTMCCLGVLAELRGELGIEGGCDPNNDYPDEGPDYAASGIPNSYAGMSADHQGDLADLNDKSDSFTPVIARIRELFIPEAKP